MDQFDAEFFGFSPKEAAILDPAAPPLPRGVRGRRSRTRPRAERFDGRDRRVRRLRHGRYFAYNLLTNPELVDGTSACSCCGTPATTRTSSPRACLPARPARAERQRADRVLDLAGGDPHGVQSLLSGECDMALAGGVTIEVPHGRGYHYKEGEILSPDGHCRSVRRRSAKGTVFGSGAGVVVLRRLQDALATATTSRGHQGLGGQQRRLAQGRLPRAVASTARPPRGRSAGARRRRRRHVGYIECHGTGTPIGDPIEVAALTQAFRAATGAKRLLRHRLGEDQHRPPRHGGRRGQPDQGHAGAAHGRSRRALNFRSAQPALRLRTSSPFFVVDPGCATGRAASTPRRAGVNSLGVGGTNAFVMLEEAPNTRTGGGASRQLVFMFPRAAARNTYAWAAASTRPSRCFANTSIAGWTSGLKIALRRRPGSRCCSPQGDITPAMDEDELAVKARPRSCR
jgi:hypothetical protein